MRLLEKIDEGLDKNIASTATGNSKDNSFASKAPSKGKAVDPSHGKGAHTKAHAKNANNQKVVFTLPNEPEPLPYQIRRLRKGFITLGYYPDYLESIIKRVK